MNKASRTIIIIFLLQTELVLFQERFLSSINHDTKKTQPSKRNMHIPYFSLEISFSQHVIILTQEQTTEN